jgi:hypothetical protein
MARRRKSIQNLPVIESNAAGADVGATQIFVAVPADRDPEPVRCFDTFTVDLEALADWLESCGIRTVAMESTEFTGSRCSRFWRGTASKLAWSMPDT